MAIRARGFARHATGTITDNPLAAGATTINSAAFADLPFVDANSRVSITLDPGGDNERCEVTAHTASATSVTVTRGASLSHAAGTVWVASIYEDDLHGGLSLVDIPFGGADDEEFDRFHATAIPASFTALNAGSMTYIEQFGGGAFSLAGAAASHQWRGIYKTLPSSSEVRSKAFGAWPWNSGAVWFGGLIFRESDTGKLLTIGQSYVDYMAVGQWTNQTTHSAWAYLQQNAATINFRYYRVIRNSSTDWDIQVSPDGRCWWELLAAHNPTTFMSSAGPDQVGVAVNAEAVTSGMIVGFTVEHLRFTT